MGEHGLDRKMLTPCRCVHRIHGLYVYTLNWWLLPDVSYATGLSSTSEAQGSEGKRWKLDDCLRRLSRFADELTAITYSGSRMPAFYAYVVDPESDGFHVFYVYLHFND
jgi:hypothetical protein